MNKKAKKNIRAEQELARDKVPIVGSITKGKLDVKIKDDGSIDGAPLGFVERPKALGEIGYGGVIAVKVTDDYLPPPYRSGSVLYADRDEPPDTGDSVLCRLKNSTETHWRKFEEKESIVVLNPACEGQKQIVVGRDEIVWNYTVVGIALIPGYRL